VSTLPRKKSRRIVVDDIPFRWKVSRKSGWSGSDPAPGYMEVLVQAEEKPGPLLKAKLTSNKWDSNEHGDGGRYNGGDSWMYPTHKASLKPVDVEWLIRNGIDQGWVPEGGKQALFELTGPISSGDYDVL
jgi:hypothetical protein